MSSDRKPLLGQTAESEPVVLLMVEHLRDGVEESAKAFTDRGKAVDWLNMAVQRGSFFLGNTTFRLFKLGEEIPLEAKQETQPQPDKVVRRYFTTGGE